MTALMIGIQGFELNEQDKKHLQHPLVAGVILFSRNYQNYSQIGRLVRQIRALRGENFLLAVDQEGGRVIRFGEPFTQLPPLAALGQRLQRNKEDALAMTHLHAWLMASELLSIGIDLNFAPVLDIDNGSEVIGDRALSNDPHHVCELGRMYCGSMRAAGMATTAKHYPGHGTVQADSHHHITQDERPLHIIENLDLVPFRTLITTGLVNAVMMSHVIYSETDKQPAGFSPYWINYLRQHDSFDGVVISDDLAMTGAASAGDIKQRYQACVQADVDLALLCQTDMCEQLLTKLTAEEAPGYRKKVRKLTQLKGHSTLDSDRPFWEQYRWQQARKAFIQLQNS